MLIKSRLLFIFFSLFNIENPYKISQNSPHTLFFLPLSIFIFFDCICETSRSTEKILSPSVAEHNSNRSVITARYVFIKNIFLLFHKEEGIKCKKKSFKKYLSEKKSRDIEKKKNLCLKNYLIYLLRVKQQLLDYNHACFSYKND